MTTEAQQTNLIYAIMLITLFLAGIYTHWLFFFFFLVFAAWWIVDENVIKHDRRL